MSNTWIQALVQGAEDDSSRNDPNNAHHRQTNEQLKLRLMGMQDTEPHNEPNSSSVQPNVVQHNAQQIMNDQNEKIRSLLKKMELSTSHNNPQNTLQQHDKTQHIQQNITQHSEEEKKKTATHTEHTEPTEHTEHKKNTEDTEDIDLDGGDGAPVLINVGGKQFTTTLGTLTRYPGSMLSALVTNGFYESTCRQQQQQRQWQRGTIFIDRDPSTFGTILNFLRDSTTALYYAPELSDPARLRQLQMDAMFFCLPELASSLAVCNHCGSGFVRSVGIDSDTDTAGEEQSNYNASGFSQDPDACSLIGPSACNIHLGKYTYVRKALHTHTDTCQLNTPGAQSQSQSQSLSQPQSQSQSVHWRADRERPSTSRGASSRGKGHGHGHGHGAARCDGMGCSSTDTLLAVWECCLDARADAPGCTKHTHLY